MLENSNIFREMHAFCLSLKALSDYCFIVFNYFKEISQSIVHLEIYFVSQIIILGRHEVLV